MRFGDRKMRGKQTNKDEEEEDEQDLNATTVESMNAAEYKNLGLSASDNRDSMERDDDEEEELLVTGSLFEGEGGRSSSSREKRRSLAEDEINSCRNG